MKSTSRTSDIARQTAVLIAAIATIAYNGLSQALPIGGRTSADVSNAYPTYFTPANYAFAIWGVIYLLLFAYGIYQALPAQRENPNARRIGWLFVINCILNCVWITLFQYDQILLSLVVIIGMLLSLIAIYLRLNVGHVSVSTADRWLLHLPFSVYMGWVSVATIANVAVLGVAQNWGDLFGIAAPNWAAIMLGVAALVGLLMASIRRDVAYIAVFVWAFVAIINKQSATPVVVTTALIAVLVLLAGLAASLLLNRRKPQNLIQVHT